MARVSVSNEFFRQKARRQLMHEEDHSQTRLSELDSLKAKVDKMAVTIQESQKRNELLVQEIGTLKDQLHNPSESLLLRRIEEIEKNFFHKVSDTAKAINDLRKEACLPTNDKLANITASSTMMSRPPQPQASLGIPWGAPNSRPWSSELESTAISVKDTLLRKRLAPELGTKITIFEDASRDPSIADASQNHEHLFEVLDTNLTPPIAKNSSPSRPGNFENIPTLDAPHTRTRSKSPPKQIKIEPARRTRRQTRRKPLSNITSKANAEEESEDDAVFDFVEPDDLVRETGRRKRRKTAV